MYARTGLLAKVSAPTSSTIQWVVPAYVNIQMELAEIMSLTVDGVGKGEECYIDESLVSLALNGCPNPVWLRCRSLIDDMRQQSSAAVVWREHV